MNKSEYSMLSHKMRSWQWGWKLTRWDVNIMSVLF